MSDLHTTDMFTLKNRLKEWSQERENPKNWLKLIVEKGCASGVAYEVIGYDNYTDIYGRWEDEILEVLYEKYQLRFPEHDADLASIQEQRVFRAVELLAWELLDEMTTDNKDKEN